MQEDRCVQEAVDDNDQDLSTCHAKNRTQSANKHRPKIVADLRAQGKEKKK